MACAGQSNASKNDALAVTPQMKTAGAIALETWDGCCSADELAAKVYIAMQIEKIGPPVVTGQED